MTAPADAVERELAPITLATVNASTELLTRSERKYLVDLDVYRELVHDLSPDLLVLEIDDLRVFRYASVYFDTDDFRLHRAAATGRRHRYKIRTRQYVESGLTMLEVKTKDGRGRTVKHRIDHDGAPDALSPADQRFVLDVTGDDSVVELLAPVLTTRYTRTTLVQLSAGVRATVDRDLVCTDSTGRSVGSNGVIIETKGLADACLIDRWLWRNGHRPHRISKCSAGLGALQPALPSNKWRRVIDRHFVMVDDVG